MSEKDVRNEVNETPPHHEGYDINADENQNGTTHLNEPLEEENEISKLKAELAESQDRYLRKVAEFENFRKRSAKERAELIQTAGKELIIDLLDVLDDYDRALKQLEASEDKALKEGVNLILGKFRNILQAKGLKPMEAVGKDFDPDLHEAITEIPAQNDDLKGKVVDEVVKGYYLSDKIIRHAKVVVGK